ncbi:MAG TPA: hypothetical protein VG929_02250 [Actinomycetota bacterium]|nr:hypothetical protein [Actinomycetota bacterium]
MSDRSRPPDATEPDAREGRPMVMPDEEPRADHRVGGPAGWVPTAIGGALGGVFGGFLAMLASVAYVDSQPSDGFEGIVTVAIWTCIGAVVGGGAGAAGLLRLRGHDRPVASGVLFGVIYAACAFGFFAAVATFTPDWDGQVWMSVVAVISLFVSALTARAILARRRTSAPPE